MPPQRVDNRLVAKCGADARLAPGAALAAATAQRKAAAEVVAKATSKAQARARHPAAVGASAVRVLALDMDGTTLNSAQQLAPRTLAALRRARSAGIEVVIATGRPAYVLQRTVDELALPGSAAAGVPCVNFNGACAMRMYPAACAGATPRPPQLLFAEALSEQTTAAALDVCEALGLCVSYTAADGATAAPVGADHERLLARFEALEGVRQQRGGGGGGGGCCRHLLGRVPALKVIALTDTPEASAAAARAALPPGLCNVVAAEVHIEFLRADVSKGLSLRRLCGGGGGDGGGGSGGRLGVGMCAVRAYGDNHNDADMLRLAGQGVAMANAKDAVKALPGVRVCEWSNDEDGVAREVELLLAARAADGGANER
jgi:hydroxymethylpyrimidine pyrophosphatase-like HAD family hydrolase